ncbi:hypothetical protein D3C80_1913590 [compost metagenome]
MPIHLIGPRRQCLLKRCNKLSFIIFSPFYRTDFNDLLLIAGDRNTAKFWLNTFRKIERQRLWRGDDLRISGWILVFQMRVRQRCGSRHNRKDKSQCASRAG